MRYTIRTGFLAGLVGILLGVCAVTGYAHPPKSPVLSYDPGSGVLTVAMTHGVSNVDKHYIERIEVSGERPDGRGKEEYTSQPSEKEWTLTFDLGALKAGDSIQVKATCNVLGSIPPHSN
jgi:hypothetical protein